jgi:hypothetical protein
LLDGYGSLNLVLGPIKGEECEEIGLVVFVGVAKEGAEATWWSGELGRRRLRGNVLLNAGRRRGEGGASESSGMTEARGVMSSSEYSAIGWEMLRPPDA